MAYLTRRHEARRRSMPGTRALALGSAAFLAGTLVAGVLAERAAIARAAVYHVGRPFDVDGVYGRQYDGEPLVLVVLGDSIAAGVGASEADKTMAVQMATKLADARRRPVRLFNVAQVGGMSRHLQGQIHDFRHRASDIGPDVKPDVAYINVGGNDVLESYVSFSEARGDYRMAVHELEGMGARVVFGTCPDVSSVPIMRKRHLPFAPRIVPAIARRMAKAWARRQHELMAQMPSTTVYVAPLGELMGDELTRDPDCFAADRFHLGDKGQEFAADKLVRYLDAAATAGPPPPEPSRPGQVTKVDATTPPLSPSGRGAVRAAMRT